MGGFPNDENPIENTQENATLNASCIMFQTTKHYVVCYQIIIAHLKMLFCYERKMGKWAVKDCSIDYENLQ